MRTAAITTAIPLRTKKNFKDRHLSLGGVPNRRPWRFTALQQQEHR